MLFLLNRLNGLLKHLGGSPWGEVFEILRGGFSKSSPCKPFYLWKNIGMDFKDLIGGSTDFDLTKRPTAQEALAHRWFRGL